jgi:4-diphosphocytidyl-2-C-methyl-D-erythritol kinase
MMSFFKTGFQSPLDYDKIRTDRKEDVNEMLTLKAYAKINLFLNVVGLRPDGYHDLEMVNAKVALADILKFKEVFGQKPVTIISNDKYLERDPNLLYRVADFMLEHYAKNRQIEIEIEKIIPAGAGLAGNSTDAATIIKGINQLFDLKLSQGQMRLIGLRFGADIPYCLIDKIALVRGIGEIIDEIPFSFEGYKVLIVKPEAFVRTEDVFALGDEIGYGKHDLAPGLAALQNQDAEGFIKTMRNSLEPITFTLSPETEKTKQLIVSSLGESGVLMSGSGSTIIKIVRGIDDGISSFIKKYEHNHRIYLVNIINNE